MNIFYLKSLFTKVKITYNIHNNEELNLSTNDVVFSSALNQEPTTQFSKHGWLLQHFRKQASKESTQNAWVNQYKTVVSEL